MYLTCFILFIFPLPPSLSGNHHSVVLLYELIFLFVLLDTSILSYSTRDKIISGYYLQKTSTWIFMSTQNEMNYDFARTL